MFNFDEASKHYSKEEIVSYLEESGTVDFKFTDARKAGASDDDIYDYLYEANSATDTSKEFEAITQAQPTVATEQPIPVAITDQPTIPTSTATSTPEIVPPAMDIQVAETTPQDSMTTKPRMSVPMYDTQGGVEMRDMYDDEAKSTFDTERELRVSNAKAAATESTFPQLTTDPETGERISIDPDGITAEIPFIVAGGAKLGMMSVEGMLGRQSTSLGQAAQLIEETFIHAKAANLSPTLSNEAKLLLLRNPDVTEAQAAEWLADVPKPDQAYVLARRLGKGGIGSIQQAVKTEGDIAAGKLRADITRPRSILLNRIGKVDVAGTKAQYKDMVDTIAKDYHSVYDASDTLADLNFLEKFYGTAPSTGNRVVSQMKAILDDNPKVNLSDALEFRADLNYLINKSTRGKETIKLKQIKNSMDKFINSVATPEQKILIDNAVSNYSRTMQNRDMLELIEKNTDPDNIINWTKLSKDLDKENLTSPEATMALQLTKELSERFGNDIRLASVTTTKGSSTESGGFIGAMGYISNTIKNTLALYGTRSQNLKIQNAIRKSIMNSETPLEFMNAIKIQEDLPVELVENLDNAFKMLTRTPQGLTEEQTTYAATKLAEEAAKAKTAAPINDEVFKSFVENRSAANDYRSYIGSWYGKAAEYIDTAGKAKVRNAVNKFKKSVSADMTREEFTATYDEFLKSLGKAGVKDKVPESPAEFYRKWKGNKNAK